MFHKNSICQFLKRCMRFDLFYLDYRAMGRVIQHKKDEDAIRCGQGEIQGTKGVRGKSVLASSERLLGVR